MQNFELMTILIARIEELRSANALNVDNAKLTDAVRLISEIMTAPPATAPTPEPTAEQIMGQISDRLLKLEQEQERIRQVIEDNEGKEVTEDRVVEIMGENIQDVLTENIDLGRLIQEELDEEDIARSVMKTIADKLAD